MPVWLIQFSMVTQTVHWYCEGDCVGRPELLSSTGAVHDFWWQRWRRWWLMLALASILRIYSKEKKNKENDCRDYVMELMMKRNGWTECSWTTSTQRPQSNTLAPQLTQWIRENYSILLFHQKSWTCCVQIKLNGAQKSTMQRPKKKVHIQIPIVRSFFDMPNTTLHRDHCHVAQKMWRKYDWSNQSEGKKTRN